MSAAVTLLATAAATMGAVSAVRFAKRRIMAAEARVEAVRRKQAARREAGVLDLEPDAVTGVYRVAPPARLGGDEQSS